jgi:hypothetical protein
MNVKRMQMSESIVNPGPVTDQSNDSLLGLSLSFEELPSVELSSRNLPNDQDDLST